MSTTQIVTVSHVTTTVVDAAPLAARELAHACGASLDWVAELAEHGIVAARSTRVEQWSFDSTELRQALEARRLQREFDLRLDAAALILDLQHEVRRLKALLSR